MGKIEVFYAFTDGSCKPNPGSGGWCWVFYFPHKNTVIRFIDTGGKKKTTNNEMELTAMLECLQFLQKKDKPYKVIVYSDSEYVLKGLVSGGNGIVGIVPNGWCHNWKKNGWKNRPNLLLWQKIYQECQRCYKDGIKLELRWVEGHSGDEGNDLADNLAKRAVPK
uniref:ribonuclease H n=1 Tax=Marseillevirus LCMAC101 TaxID=2506602 RepID=A0A481YRL8_9VIRU|nr:MAG: ribonuclease H [Marseillevirus LCMAC101]